MCLRQLAGYRDHAAAFRDAGFDLARLSVDEPVRSDAVRREHQLPFPILCDTRREVIGTWGVITRNEKGGIAIPATLVFDRDRRVLFSSLDGEFNRVGAKALLEYLQRPAAGSGPRSPRRRFLLASPGDWWRAIRGAFRFGLRSPRT